MTTANIANVRHYLTNLSFRMILAVKKFIEEEVTKNISNVGFLPFRLEL